MKLSLRWLARHVDLDGLSADRIRDDLSMCTAEVEGRHDIGTGLESIVVGHVVSREKHASADKLSVTQVDVGGPETLQIVCGASNVAAGQKVAVVTPGGTLPDGTKITKAKLRGVESFGMICSERELGLSDAHEGILVLDANAVPGRRLTDVLPITDTVLEIDNKSVNHRPDLWGHRGFAREIAAIHRRPLKPLGLTTLAKDVTPNTIRIADTTLCPRYCGLVLERLTAAPSPAWLRGLLRAVGQRSIDLLVDLTNFVMLDLGQPMHAFDLDAVDPTRIGVRTARAGERITTLDDVERTLLATDLLITSDDRPVALAGVMGGKASGIRAGTTSMFLESATFHPATIRRTSTRLGLRSDASARFEKSLDPDLAEIAARQFVTLLQQELPTARVRGSLLDPAHWRSSPKRIHLRLQRLHDVLGTPVERAFVAETLRWLEFDVVDVVDGFDVGVPSFRATKDVSIEADLVEEIGRMLRYDNIPEVPLRSVVTVPPREPELVVARELISLAATELGCHEVYNYSFVADDVRRAVLAADHAYVRTSNPVAPELACIRRHVLPSTLAAAAPGLRVAPEVRFVEHGKGYDPSRRDAHQLPHETREIAFVWLRRDGAAPAYPELRSGIEAVLSRFARGVTMHRTFVDADQPWFHPGRTVAIEREGRVVGAVGALHPAVAANLGIGTNAALASLDVRAWLAGPEDDERMRPIARFPSQPVDVALLVAESTQVKDVVALLRRSGGALVRDVTLFEVYRGEGIAPGRKSLNFTVTLGSDERTLSATDGEQVLARIRAAAAEIGAELRG